MGAKKVVENILLVLITLPFAFSGFSDLFSSFMMEQMTRLNYSPIFTYILGVGKLVFLAGLWFFKRKYRKLSFFFLFGIISGGIAAHISAGDGLAFASFAIGVGVLMVIYAWLRWDLFICKKK